jgi:hypothetical protein
MATNPFFNQKFPAEQLLVEDITIEMIRMMGQDMIYVPREMLLEDSIFGEAGKYEFKDAYPIEMYIESVNGFEGEGDVLSKFGIQVKDKVSLVVAKKRFEKEISEKRPEITRPREGDLIYFPLSNGLFEINFAEHENPFYAIGKLYVYKLTCELFTYDHSNMTTGVTEIDNLQKEQAYNGIQINVGLIPGISPISYYEGEKVMQYNEIPGQTGSIQGDPLSVSTITDYTRQLNKLIVTTEDQIEFIPNTIMKGEKSNALWYMTGLTGSNVIIPKNPVINENFGDNDATSLKTKTENIINYCEKDPFSEGKF